MDRLIGIEVFVAVVDEEGFTAAARRLNVSKSYVSKRVRGLEDRLGVRLLNRTTRQLSLTDEGSAYYERCARILEDLDEAELALGQLRIEPRGTLRLSVPMTFGVRYLAPLFGEFLRRHENLRLDVDFADRLVDLVDEGYDLAVRIGDLEDSSMIARKVARTRFYVCASPDYISSRGEPAHPSELAEHNCLLYRYQATASTWRFVDEEGETISVRVGGTMRTNNGASLVDAAVSGVGIALLPDFIASDALRAGELERILRPWERSEYGIWAVYPHKRHLSTKVRHFVDFLADSFGDPPPWSVDD